MKRLILISSLLALTSCGEGYKELVGAKLQTPNLGKNKFEVNYPNPLKVNRPTVSDLRDATFIVYANAEDFKSFEYLPDQDEWNSLFRFLNYEMPYYGIQKDLSNGEKASRLVQEIQTIGQVRDEAFLVSQAVKLDTDKKREKKIELTSQLKKGMKSYKCYPLLADKNKCKLIKDVETNEKAKTYKIKGNCKRIDQAVERTVDLTAEANPDQFSKFDQAVKSCDEITALSDFINPLDEKAEPYVLVRSAGKQQVALIMEKLQRDTGIQHLSVISTLLEEEEAARDDAPIPPRSSVIFNADKTGFDEFKLYIDFGGFSFKEYSLANGKIQKMKIFEDKPGIYKVTFTLTAPAHRTEADLTLNFGDPNLDHLPLSNVYKTEKKNLFGVRMIGTTENFYPDGNMRHGVIKIELDYVQ